MLLNLPPPPPPPPPLKPIKQSGAPIPPQTTKKVFLNSEYSPSRPFLHALCVFDRLDASEAQSVLCLSVLERAAHARARTHTHTHTHTSAWETASLVRIVLSTFYYQTCPANLVTVKTEFYNNRQTIDLILKFWSGRNECAPLWREGRCARRNAAIILRSQIGRTLEPCKINFTA